MTNNGFVTRMVCAFLAAVALASVSSSALTQNPKAGNSSDTDTHPYNKHDFGGLWSHNPQEVGLSPCPECREQYPIPVPGYGYFGDVPARTPEGEHKLQMTRHGRGFEPDSEG